MFVRGRFERCFRGTETCLRDGQSATRGNMSVRIEVSGHDRTRDFTARRDSLNAYSICYTSCSTTKSYERCISPGTASFLQPSGKAYCSMRLDHRTVRNPSPQTGMYRLHNSLGGHTHQWLATFWKVPILVWQVCTGTQTPQQTTLASARPIALFKSQERAQHGIRHVISSLVSWDWTMAHVQAACRPYMALCAACESYSSKGDGRGSAICGVGIRDDLVSSTVSQDENTKLQLIL
jgi:hypothetical protein